MPGSSFLDGFLTTVPPSQSGCSTGGSSAGLVVADVVDVAAEPVAGAVHVELAVRRRLDHRVDVADDVAIEQARVEHSLGEDADGGGVRVAQASARVVAATAADCAASTMS